MRLFIAIPIDADAKRKIAGLQEKLRSSKTRMTLVPPQNMHLTLRFIGEGDPAEWIRRIDSLSEKRFELAFDRIGFFPARGAPRVLWVGCGPVESLLNVHRVIGGEEPVPHITLARLRSRPDEAVLSLSKERPDIRITVDRIQLINSTLTPLGPRYDVLHEKTL